MFFLLLGIVGIALKYLEVAPVAGWPWWVVLAPFGLALRADRAWQLVQSVHAGTNGLQGVSQIGTHRHISGHGLTGDHGGASLLGAARTLTATRFAATTAAFFRLANARLISI